MYQDQRTFDVAHYDALTRLRPTVASMIEKAIDGTRWTRGQVKGIGRTWEVVRIRFAIYQAAHEWGYSTPQIGQAMGGRDHTTILNGLKRVQALHLMSDPDFRFYYDRISCYQAELPLEQTPKPL